MYPSQHSVPHGVRSAVVTMVSAPGPVVLNRNFGEAAPREPIAKEELNSKDENRIRTNIKMTKLVARGFMESPNAMSSRFNFGSFDTLCCTASKRRQQR